MNIQTLPTELYDVEAVRRDFPILAREVHGSRSSISTTALRRRSRSRCWT